MSTTGIAFIIGSGSNVGKNVAKIFKEKGYTVAIGSRNPDVESSKSSGYFPVKISAGEIDSVREAFAEVNKALGPPNVVIYNPGAMTVPPTRGDPLSLPAETFTKDLNVGTGVYYAAQQALAGFRSAKNKDLPKAFIVTGNGLPYLPPQFPNFISLGTQKVLALNLVETFARAYSKEDSRFYYASYTAANGGIPSDFAASGPAHAQAYWELANRKEQGNWDHRFGQDGKVLSEDKYKLDLNKIDELLPAFLKS